MYIICNSNEGTALLPLSLVHNRILVYVYFRKSFSLSKHENGSICYKDNNQLLSLLLIQLRNPIAIYIELSCYVVHRLWSRAWDFLNKDTL